MLNYLYPKLNDVATSVRSSTSAIIQPGLTLRYPRIKGEKKEGGDSELQKREGVPHTKWGSREGVGLGRDLGVSRTARVSEGGGRSEPRTRRMGCGSRSAERARYEPATEDEGGDRGTPHRRPCVSPVDSGGPLGAFWYRFGPIWIGRVFYIPPCLKNSSSYASRYF